MIRDRARIARFRLTAAASLGALAGILAMTTGAAAAPDLILTNGAIYTVDPAKPWVEAVAIENGRYSALGSNAEIARLAGKNTRVIDLGGRMAMPGLTDAHAHPVQGAVGLLYMCNFPFTATPDDIAATIAKCVAANPRAEWIIGGQWDSGFFDRFKIDSPRAFLDKVSGGKAIYLSDDSGHNGWVNSRALELAGITAQTPDPASGTIVRLADGSPSGVLLEAANPLVEKVIPPRPPEQLDAAVREAARLANGYGITAFKDAMVSEPVLAAFQRVDNKGQLTVHAATALLTPYEHRTAPLDVATFAKLRDTYAAPHVHTNFVKVFMDGVPTASRTAAMLSPYVHAEGFPDHYTGMLHVDPAVLKQDMVALDKAGFTVKIHTAGDRSVRVALDAIEAARTANGPSDRRHELAHAGYVDDADLPRFKSLNAVADLSPYIFAPSPIIDSVIGAVGKRGEHYWPVRDLLSSGAPVLAGSDWPSAVPSINPWPGIEQLVTRADPDGQRPGTTLWGEQAITLTETLRIFTHDNARALRLDDRTGTIARGKSADLIVLDRHLFKISPADISETQVVLTLFEGKPVHQVAGVLK